MRFLTVFLFIYITSLVQAETTTTVIEEASSPIATQLIEHKRDNSLRLREVRRASKKGGKIDSILLFVFLDGKVRASYARYPKESIYPSSFSVQNAEGIDVNLLVDNEYGAAKSIIVQSKDKVEIVFVDGLTARLASDEEIAAFAKSKE